MYPYQIKSNLVECPSMNPFDLFSLCIDEFLLKHELRVATTARENIYLDETVDMAK